MNSAEQEIEHLLEQGFSRYRAGDLPEAANIYSRILDHHPRHFGALYLLGLLTYGRGDPAKAVEFLGRALEIQPFDPDCLNLQGLALASLHKNAEAEICFRKALEIRPSAELFNSLGVLLKQQDRLSEALHAFESAMVEDPACEDALYNLGNLFRAQGRLDEARERFRQVLIANPRHANALAALGQTLLSFDDSEAEEILRRATQEIPDDADLKCDLGDALSALGKAKEAAVEYVRAIALNDKLSRPWYSVVCLHNARGAYSDAA